ncbi:hypothetical protein A2U01_0060981, partial [Trifolium medium]|nr:hypothetical protein [Trifolium medium]
MPSATVPPPSPTLLLLSKRLPSSKSSPEPPHTMIAHSPPLAPTSPLKPFLTPVPPPPPKPPNIISVPLPIQSLVPPLTPPFTSSVL